MGEKESVVFSLKTLVLRAIQARTVVFWSVIYSNDSRVEKDVESRFRSGEWGKRRPLFFPKKTHLEKI
ncbi:MAG: hypothetical protein D6714_11505 [Bacteroidetes bacterium]|nr:MAG: hypothetical protein D6714_11505 [Bacteroidota bacterium]